MYFSSVATDTGAFGIPYLLEPADSDDLSGEC